MNKNEIIIYTTEDQKVKIEVLYKDNNLWLTQKKMAELYGVNISAISKHLKNIFNSGELKEEVVISKMETTTQHGAIKGKTQTKETSFYSLEAIIAVGYRVNSSKGTQFRQWATNILHNYIYKGFSIDSDRFKNGSKFDKKFFDELLEEIREIRASERMFYQKITDIYATSIDYQKDNEITKNFFATVQNKLLFAITKQTSAEIIKNRVDSSKKNMGLNTWKKAPNGKIMFSDTIISKNYLSKEELNKLNRIVSMYIDYAESQAEKHILMKMTDWIEKLDSFLKFNEYDILNNIGKVSHKIAEDLAKEEYEKFKVIQDKNYKSDFDKELEELEEITKINKNGNNKNE